MTTDSNPLKQQQYVSTSKKAIAGESQVSQPSKTSQYSQEPILAVFLKFDVEMRRNLYRVLEQTGLDTYQLVMKAVTYYIHFTLNHLQNNLVFIATDKLLYDSAYKTYPGRAEELTRRAIKAIEIYNQQQPHPWAITQSIIVALIKARPASVKKALIPWRQEIEEHNHYYQVNGYTNRNHQEAVTDAINIVKLVPHGLI